MRRAVLKGPILYRLLISCLGIVLALGLAELGLRVLPWPPVRYAASYVKVPPSMQDDLWMSGPPRYAWRVEPGKAEFQPNVDERVRMDEHAGGGWRFHTNNLGLRRDADTAIQKGPGLFRVLVLGDSHTAGYVDNAENLCALLEASLSRRLAADGRRAEVLNGGVDGYGPRDYLRWYRENGAQLQPDLVLVVYYVGNDLVWWEGDRLHRIFTEPWRSRLVLNGSGEPIQLLRDLRLLWVARNMSYDGPLNMLWRRLFADDDRFIQVLRTCPGCYAQSLNQTADAPHEPRALEQAFGDTADILTQLGREVGASGGDSAVALLPTRYQVEPDLAAEVYRRTAALLGLGEADLDFDDEVSRGMLDRLTATGVTTFSLKGPLRAVRTGEPLYYERDWHLNALGHRVAALALDEQLTRLGLLPPGPERARPARTTPGTS